jgi:hypothetical protein
MTHPRLLLTVPYGMALRNLVFSPDLWNELVTTFEVDVFTPVAIRNPDGLGIRRVIPADRPGSVVESAARSSRRTAVIVLSELDRLAFFMINDEAETYRAIYQAYLRRGVARRLPFFAWLGHSAGGPALKRFLRAFGACRLFGEPRVADYDYVLLPHTSEHMCASLGLAANAAGVPVICAPLAVDNLLHGPMLFRPDLMLLWGEEQRRDFDCQVAFNPEFRNVPCAIVGSTIHDAYLAGGKMGSIDGVYGFDAADDVILFAAYMDVFAPHQRAICDIVVDFARARRQPTKVLVRVRPGVDEAAWKAYQIQRADVVRLQIPDAAGYDKSGFITGFDRDREFQEVVAFAATMRRARMLVIPSLSTMTIDAMLFGVPVVCAIFEPASPATVLSDVVWHRVATAKMPWWGDLRVAASGTQLLEALRDVLERDRAAAYASDMYFMSRATARDGQAGCRTLEALRAFVAEHPPRRGT